jgi:hypothetical protein
MKLRERLGLCARILRYRNSNILKHADAELPGADDDIQALMNRQIKEVLMVFSIQGHSGTSADYAIRALQKLLRFEPLTTLTGEPSEWVEVGTGVFQNRRYGCVFKQPDRFDGQAYNIEGRVFREPNGNCYTSRDSRVLITFPYWPTTEYVDVEPEDDQ